MKRTLGIEGGGTKTEWIYAFPEGRRRGFLPAANLRLITNERLEEILKEMPHDPEPEQVGIFLAGCANEADRERLRTIAHRVWPTAKIVVGGDRESGFAAAFKGGDGITVISGTGSAITGRRGDQMEKAGGWGHLLGDKGSGYDLAMQGLRYVLWNYDITHKVTETASAILARLGLNRLEDLGVWVKEADKMAVAKLAPVVFEAAAAGDEKMSLIIATGASTLADGAGAVARRLGLKEPQICLQGGLFEHHPEYVQRFAEAMGILIPGARVFLSEHSGAEGALWLAGHEEERPTEEETLDAFSLSELAIAATEKVNPRSEGWEKLGTRAMVDLFVSEEGRVEEALAQAREDLADGVNLIAGALRKGGRLFYVGAGTSGRLGVLDASEIPPTFGTQSELVQGIMAGGVEALFRAVEGAEDSIEGGALAVVERGVREGDVVCGITASGRTPFVLGALKRAVTLGAKTMLVSCNPARRHEAAWDVEIDLATGPELLAGSTRLKAGTATKCALNILTTGAMVKLGRTKGNLMGSVMVTNAKLRDRAIRLVENVRGVPRSQAEAILEEEGWDVARSLQNTSGH